MKSSELNLGSIAIASLAFLLNWVVFVDSGPLAALTASFDELGTRQHSTLVPIFPPDKTILAFDTPTYAVQLLERNDTHYLSVRDRASGTVLVDEGVVQSVWQGGQLSGYDYQPADVNQPAWQIRHTDGQNLELTRQNADQQYTELGHQP